MFLLPPLALVGLSLLALGLATWAHVAFWSRYLRVPAEYDEVHSLTLSDGGRVELRRLGRPTGTPVLLLHGIAANHRNVDPLAQRSLARALAAEHDVWLLTLRMGVRRQPAPSTLETMVSRDLPEALRFVAERRDGAEPIDLVGFSLGGLVVMGAIALRLVRGEQVRRVVLIGAPAEIVDAPLRLPLVTPLLGPLRLLFRAVFRLVPRWALPRVPTRFFANLFASSVGALRTPWHRWVVNPRGLARGELPRAMVTLVEDIPASLYAELATLWRQGGEVRMYGRELREAIAHAAPLPPALFVVGAEDMVVAPAASRVAFERWGDSARWIEVPGFAHADLMLSREAPGAVFAPVVAFLGA